MRSLPRSAPPDEGTLHRNVVFPRLLKRASIRATKMRFPSFLLACSVACSFACSKDRDYTEDSVSTGGLGGAAGEAGSNTGGNGTGGSGGNGASGNGTGGTSSVTPTIQTEELSAAQLNQPYSATLEAEGGTGDLTFELAEGTLPPGLTLDENGKLRGTPRTAGTFTFTVRVTDEKEKTASAELTLVVSRKDWLVYRSDKAERFLTRLYAVQLSSALMPVTEIAGGALPATARVHSMLFSPDGKTLAFLADTLTTTEYDVYVVDMSTKVPGKPKALGFALSGTGTLSWSPNGKRLACSAYSEVKVIDLSEDTPEPKSLGAGNRGYWVSDTQIAFVRYATPDVNLMRADWPVGDEPGTPQALPISAFCFGATCSEYFQAHPALNIYEYGAMDPSGGMTTRNVLFSATDTAWSTSYENDGRPVSPLSRDFKLGVKFDTGNALGIVELPSHDATKALADVGTLSRWANTSHELLVSSTSGKFQLVDADAETLTAVDIPGTYGTPDGDHCKHRFSPDDSWVSLFDEEGNTYVSKLGSQSPGEAQLVGTLAAQGTFSPDSRFYAFAGDPTNTGAIDLSLVDLSSGTPTAPVQQNERGTNETERDVQVSYAGPCSGHDSRLPDSFFFSPNSSHLVHMVRQGYGSAYLYVTDLLDTATGELAGGRTGVNRTGSIACTNECSGDTCTTSCGTTEMDFVFQP